MSPIRNIPKVELHLHLEGAVRISTLKELSILKGITGIREPRSTDKDEYEPYREFYCITKPTDSLSSFIVLFTRLGLVLNTPDVLERITFEVIEDAISNGTVALEIRYSPQFLVCDTMVMQAIHDSIMRGLRTAKSTFQDRIQVGLICIINRSFPLESALETFEILKRNIDDFIGIDLASDEKNPATPFATIFQEAKGLGLGVTVHAGEAGPAENIKEAILLLGASRIGHGVRILDSEEIISLAIEKNVLLEVCPISNYLTSVYPSYQQHKINKLIEKGLTVSVSTDDPGVFDKNILDEYEWLLEHHSPKMDMNMLKQMNLNAINASFFSEEIKSKVRKLLN